MSLGRMLSIARSRPNLPRFIASRLLTKTGLCDLLTIPRDGYKLHFFRSSMTMALWELGPNERCSEEALIRSLLRPGDTVVDVGANIGAVALFAKSIVGPEGRVIALEPHPRIFDYLQKNVALNRVDIETHRVAASSAPGTLHFTDQGQDDQNRVIPEGGITVPSAPLDYIVGDTGPIRLLKIDVEGFEAEVLRGATKTLARSEFIYIECWDEHLARAGSSADEVLNLLIDSGFSIVDENEEAVMPGRKFDRCENLLATRIK